MLKVQTSELILPLTPQHPSVCIVSVGFDLIGQCSLCSALVSVRVRIIVVGWLIVQGSVISGAGSRLGTAGELAQLVCPGGEKVQSHRLRAFCKLIITMIK